MNSLTWEKVFLLAIIPLGQLYARINYLKGSIDKSWTLFPLFMVPPFSFIPLIMMKMNFIKKGEGGEPFDYLILLPIIFKLFGDIILKSLFVGGKINFILSKFIVYFSLYLIYFAKDKCNDGNYKRTQRSFTNSMIVFGLVEILNEIITNFIPTFGFIEEIVKIFPLGSDLIWSFLLITSYIINNMVNNTNRDNYCFDKYNFGKNSKKGISIILLIVTVIRNLPNHKNQNEILI